MVFWDIGIITRYKICLRSTELVDDLHYPCTAAKSGIDEVDRGCAYGVVDCTEYDIVLYIESIIHYCILLLTRTCCSIIKKNTTPEKIQKKPKINPFNSAQYSCDLHMTCRSEKGLSELHSFIHSFIEQLQTPLNYTSLSVSLSAEYCILILLRFLIYFATESTVRLFYTIGITHSDNSQS